MARGFRRATRWLVSDALVHLECGIPGVATASMPLDLRPGACARICNAYGPLPALGGVGIT